MAEDLKKAYRTVMADHFDDKLEISFGSGDKRQTLEYEKVTWVVDDVEKGLRYGENPGQEAALYRLINGNLTIGEVRCIGPGRELVCGATLHQFGKHPGPVQGQATCSWDVELCVIRNAHVLFATDSHSLSTVRQCPELCSVTSSLCLAGVLTWSRVNWPLSGLIVRSRVL